MYYVTTQGRHNLTSFLIDRRVSKSSWWTLELDLAMAFRKKEAAKVQANKLTYKNPEVVDSTTAKYLEAENLSKIPDLEEYPYSSEALGQ